MSGNEDELDKISPCMINNVNQLHGKLVFGSTALAASPMFACFPFHGVYALIVPIEIC